MKVAVAVPVDPEVTITMKLSEASQLRAWIGNMPSSRVPPEASDLWEALNQGSVPYPGSKA